MEIYNKEGEPVNNEEKDKQELWKIMMISGAIDILTSTGTIATLGLGIVVEEAIENLVSQMIAKYGKVKLTKFDNLVGMIPVPGVTAITVHCGRKLLEMRAKEQLKKAKM